MAELLDTVQAEMLKVGCPMAVKHNEALSMRGGSVVGVWVGDELENLSWTLRKSHLHSWCQLLSSMGHTQIFFGGRRILLPL